MTKEQQAIEKLVARLVSVQCPPSFAVICTVTRDYGGDTCVRCWKRWAGLDVETEKAKETT